MREGLSREQSEDLERHLKRCAACRGERARMAALSGYLAPDRLVEHTREPPREAIRRRLEAGRYTHAQVSARRGHVGMAAVAPAVVIVCAAIALFVRAQRLPGRPERIVRLTPTTPHRFVREDLPGAPVSKHN